jgi:hypothetical protein
MSFARSAKAWALAAAVLFAPSLASAATLTYQTPGNIFGSNGSATVHIQSPRDIWAKAGGFALKGDISGDSALESFTAWCLDISTSINLSYNYTVTNSPFSLNPLSATQKSNIQALFNTALTGLDLTVGKNSAGFQLALWEIVYESVGNPFNASSGNFRASNSASAIATANLLLAGLGGPITGNFDLTFLEAYNKYGKYKSQNLVTGSPIPDETPVVPLPTAGVLLLSGLLGMGTLARMRRRIAR